MTTRITPEETHAWLKNYFQPRREIGLGKLIMDIVLNPRSPFEPEARRLPRRGFLIGAGLFAFAVNWFVYFNFVN
jgi:hypothetical protein